MKICILIPVFNEAKALGALLKRLIQDKGFDVLVVDDGSTDGSGQIAQDKGARLIHHPVRMGKGKSLKDGFRMVLEKNYDGVLMMDGDGQHDPQDLEGFFKVLSSNQPIIVTGNRMADAQGMPVVRYLTNRFMSIIISLASGQSIADTQCGYRYISCEVLRNLNLQSDDFEIETEILMQASKKGYKIISIPIATIYRNEESHIHPVKDTMRFIAYFVKEVFFSKNSRNK